MRVVIVSFACFTSLVAGARFVTAQALGCYERTRRETALGGNTAVRLCTGTAGSQPLDCFEGAKRNTALGDDAAIALCRCARSSQPVACFERAKRETAVSDQRAIELCSPSVQQRLGPSCRPVVSGRLVP